ncbi:MAG: hypothetical protein KGJ86_07300, partial [Chloroflexota bacterium]|nr:hypothetical protein [Chloroflexota bacterium]
MKVRALNPVAERRRSPSTPIAARLPRLEGAVLGVIDNRRPNADIFLARLVELLQSRYQFREIVLRRKPSVTEAAPFLDEMAERCDAVVNAMVDHGACMAWSPADSANLERLGTPTATICSADVIDLCRDELRALGLESLSVIGAEPTAEIVPEAVPRCADAVLDSVVRVLTTPAEDLSRQA